MLDLSVHSVLRSRRLRRAGWVLALGVGLALGLWADRPTGVASALVVVTATLATIAVAMGRKAHPSPLAPSVASLATVALGGAIGVLGEPGSAASLVAVGLFAMASASLGPLGPVGGAALGLATIIVALVVGGAGSLSPGLLAALGGAVAGGAGVGRKLALRERADLVDRAEQTEVTWALARRAQTDALTRLPNRLAIQAVLDDAFEDTLDAGSWLSVLVVDIDHFKRINDTWGHPTGDYVLTEVAAVIQRALRKGDVAGRWGGEEFLVVLAGCAPLALASVAERLRREVEGLVLEAPDGAPIQLTVSVGGASSDGGPGEASALVGQADAALYRAKQAGRNRVALVEGASL